jgi:hypothetical protein
MRSPPMARAQHHAVRHRLFGDDADVERVAVPFDAGHAGASRDLLGAERLRDEPVERWTAAGEALRPVDLQVTGSLVELVLHRVGRDDLDIDVDGVGMILVGRDDAVPGVRLHEQTEQFDHARRAAHDGNSNMTADAWVASLDTRWLCALCSSSCSSTTSIWQELRDDHHHYRL